jgi:D-alanine transfer protein
MARAESDNNDFGFLNDYYNVNVGRRLENFRDRDVSLSYSDSPEYGDLELLLDVCRERGATPLILSVPLHGQWSDFTGFGRGARAEYYGKVNELLAGRGALFRDMSAFEYEPYFLCDAMHLGWIGWLKANEYISEYYRLGR